MDNWTSDQIQELILTETQTKGGNALSYNQSDGWLQFIHALENMGTMLTKARRQKDISSALYCEKAEQVVWLSQVLLTIMTKRYLPIPPNLAVINPSLSIREIEVLRWSAEGKTAADIGIILKLKQRTIHFHMSNAVKKMGVRNKTAAVAQALMSGVL